MGGASSITVGYKYYLGMHMVISHRVDEVQAFVVGEREAWSGSVTDNTTIHVDAPELFGGEKKEGGIKGDVDILMGAPTQAKNSYLTKLLGNDIPAYRDVLSLVLKKVYVSAMSPYPKAWAVRVKKIPAKSWYAAKADINGSANPAHIIYETLTNTDWGMGYPTSSIDDAAFKAAADALFDETLGLSFMLTRQESIENFIYEVLAHCNGMLFTNQDDGKFALKLIRDDYTPGSLPLFDESNVTRLESFERPTFAEMVNEIVVVYRPQGTIQDESVAVQDLAAVQAQGGVVSQTVQYPGIDTSDIAARVAMRDLRQKSTPLARLRVKLNREAWNLTVGDVFRFSWDAYGIDELVFRVISISYGNLDSPEITIDAAEDIFALPTSTYMGDQPSEWTDPLQSPQPLNYRRVEEATYWDLATTLRAADFDLLTDTSAFLMAYMGDPAQAAVNYELHTHPAGGSYAKVGDGNYVPHGTLTADITAAQTAVTIEDLSTRADFATAGASKYGFIDNEIVRIDAWDPDTGDLTLGRGCVDTIPAAHSAGARFWFAQEGRTRDRTEYADGETVFAKALTRTGMGVLALASAPEDSLVMAGRFAKPYPPGNLQFNSALLADAIVGELTATWAHRDRTQQTAGLVDTTNGDIGPETNVEYNLIIDDEDGAEVVNVTQSGASYTYATEADDLAKNIYPFSGQFRVVQSAPAGDSAWWAVGLYLRFNGADASTDFVDETGKTLTVNGNAQLDTADPKFGSAAGLFDGSGDYLTVPMSPAFQVREIFTIEVWVKPATVSGRRVIASTRRNSNPPQGGWSLGVDNGGEFSFYAWTSGGATAYQLSAAGVISTGVWQHLSISSDGTTVRAFVDGVQVDSVAPATWGDATTASVLTIGREPPETNRDWNGSLDEFVILNGVTLRDSAFSVPTAERANLPGGDDDWESVTALLHFPGDDASTDIVDLTGTEWTANGDAQIDSAVSRFGGSSLLLDGTNDFLTAADSAKFGFGTGDFTVEAWIYLTGTEGAVFDPRTAGDTRAVFFISGGNIALYTTSLVTGPTTITQNEWHHVAWVRSGNTIYMFLDGAQEYSGSFTIDMGASAPGRIGEDFSGSVDFAGNIDSLRLTKGVGRYTAAFTLPAEPFASGTPQFPIWFYTMDNISGSTLVDEEGNHDGTIFGMTQVAGVDGQALEGDTTGDRIEVAHSADFNTPADYAISCWVRFSGTSTGIIFGKFENSDPFAGPTVFCNYKDDTNDAGFVEFRDTRDAGWRVPTNTGGLNDDQWRHYVFQRVGDQLEIWIDGELDATATLTSVLSHANGNTLFLMGRSTLQLVDGAADQYRFWPRRSFSAGEIQALASEFEAGVTTTGIPTNPLARLNGSLQIQLKAQRDGYDSHQAYNLSVDRAGYGYNYGNYYGGIA